MRKNIFLSLILCVLGAYSAFATYKIEATIVGAEDSMVYLTRYDGVKRVDVDSARFNKKGLATFSGKDILPGGLYLIRAVTPDMPEVEFMVSGEDKFSIDIYANTLNIEKSLKYSKSDENNEFKKYIDFQQNLNRTAAAIQQQYAPFQNDPDSVWSLQLKYEDLRKQQNDFADAIIAKNKGKLVSSLIKAAKEPEPVYNIPQNSTNPDSVRWFQFLAFAKEHYFDNIDFSDVRLLNTPMYENRLGMFFQQVMIYEPASEIIKSVDLVLNKASVNKDMYKYTLTWLYDRYTDSPIEGHYAVGEYLTEIMSDEKKVDWLTDNDKVKLDRNVKKYSLNPIGSVAADLMLQTPDGEHVSLHKIKAPYTVLYFFNPGCGTCLMTTPVLHEMYEMYKDQGLQVVAIFPDKDKDAWLKYIEENGYTDWVNVWDPEGNANIYEKYSLHAIPQVYVLDADKKVMNKDVHMQDLQGILYVAFSNLNNKKESK